MKRNGFTLIEMLVVIGIIVVLAALIIPAAANAVSSARNATMGIEIGELQKAIERYKQEKGDYPPSMGEIDAAGISLYLPATRFTTVCERHLRKCYPKMTNSEKQFFYDEIAPRLRGDEALVFWLGMTQADERNPFTSRAANYKSYFPFAQERLTDFDGDVFTGNGPDGQPLTMTFPSFKPRYAKETPYVYIDSRTYAMHRQKQYAIGGEVQAYFNENASSTATQQHYVNPTTFQIICAGQDGEFGEAFDQFDNNNVVLQPKRFKAGINYTGEDKDNLTNFGDGKRLVDHMP